jgi:hypothetical protein
MRCLGSRFCKEVLYLLYYTFEESIPLPLCIGHVYTSMDISLSIAIRTKWPAQVFNMEVSIECIQSSYKEVSIIARES